MFIVTLKYKKPLSEVDRFVEAHRTYLDACFKEDYFLAAGPTNPRSGGVILTRELARPALDALLQEDPFYREGVADFEVVEFEPMKCSAAMAAALGK